MNLDKIKWLFRTILIAYVSLIICACNSDTPDTLRMQDKMLGTWINIVATSPKKIDSKRVEKNIVALEAKLRQELSIFDEESLLSRFNRGEQIAPSEWMIRNIEMADSISRVSGGIYDITVAPLVKAYGFAKKEDSQERINIDSIMEFVGYTKIEIDRIDGLNVTKHDPRVQIDLNSIAKGFAVDQTAKMLEREGIENYLVEIGGEIIVKGTNPKGEAWRVGIETPIDGNMISNSVQQRVAIDASSPYRAVATSGNYRRFHTNANGEKVVHTIDPLSGKPYESTLLSATVVAANCALADGYATMLMAAGDRRAIEIAKRLADCEVYLIFSRAETDGEASMYNIYASEGMKRMLKD